MQTVIAGYGTFLDARLAVQSLEHQGFSTQDIVISDQKLSFGLKPRPTKAQHERWGADTPRFLVAMRAQPDVLVRATDVLLRASSDATVSATRPA